MNWSVYIIEASDKSYYTGITVDVERRFEEHLNGRGAKYFHGRAPRKIVFQEGSHNRSSASKREIEIKNLSRLEKETLVNRQRISSI